MDFLLRGAGPDGNLKNAKHVDVPLDQLEGTLECFASPKCRAKHRDVPHRSVERR